MRRALEKLSTTRCLTTQLLFTFALLLVVNAFLPNNCPAQRAPSGENSAREIQKELQSFRARLETEADLLKKINVHQRNEENLNAAIVQKDFRIEELEEALLAVEMKLNSTLGHSKPQKDDDDASQTGDESSLDTKAEKDIDDDQQKNHTLLPNQLTRESAPPGIAVCIIADNNVKELRKTIESVLKNMPATGFPLFISQVGADEEVTELIRSYLYQEGERTNVFYLQYLEEEEEGGEGGTRTTTTTTTTTATAKKKQQSSALSTDAMHHRWSLSMILEALSYSKAMVINDYLDVAFDFFDYLQAASGLLDEDSSIMCISAWNENGQADFAKDSGSLVRSDVFPDYAWMISSDFWRELKGEWPSSDWRPWINSRELIKGRACIIPQVCRVTVRKAPLLSAADQQLFEQYIAKIKLNKNPVKFSVMDLGFLAKSKYDAYIDQLIAASETLESAAAVKAYRGKPGDIKVLYDGTSTYVSIARSLGLPPNLKQGHPPASYNGIVTIGYGTWRLFIAPTDWEKRLAHTEEKVRSGSGGAGSSNSGGSSESTL
mmetsp:Transcript_37989/g.61003  ORF Transcript_37989/g.61003 Transcript_37989/m.61003 type:complete len:548 (-) Transcript_37989:226-1869(-)